MSQPKFQDIRCPRCGTKLFEALGISAHLVIRIKCQKRTCQHDIVQITEGFIAKMIHISDPVAS